MNSAFIYDNTRDLILATADAITSAMRGDRQLILQLKEVSRLHPGARLLACDTEVLQACA